MNIKTLRGHCFSSSIASYAGPARLRSPVSISSWQPSQAARLGEVCVFSPLLDTMIGRNSHLSTIRWVEAILNSMWLKQLVLTPVTFFFLVTSILLDWWLMIVDDTDQSDRHTDRLSAARKSFALAKRGLFTWDGYKHHEQWGMFTNWLTEFCPFTEAKHRETKKNTVTSWKNIWWKYGIVHHGSIQVKKTIKQWDILYRPQDRKKKHEFAVRQLPSKMADDTCRSQVV